MSELNFKKFSDLDVLENISATSHVVIEEDGDVKRFPANGIGKVKTINGVEPDENGNVVVETGGGVTSWNDLEDKPFYSEFAIANDRIVWDGNIEGLESIVGFAYLVSDVVPDIEDFRDGFIISYCENGTITTHDYSEHEEWASIFEDIKAMTQEFGGMIPLESLYVIPRDNFEFDGITVPKAGVYFMYEHGEDEEFYVQSLIIPGFERFSDVTVENITPLNEKYIPKTIASKEYVKEAMSGEDTEAIGYYSHAEGYKTQATGDYSHAEGYYSHAEGLYSHAEGVSSHAKGDDSHAEGNRSYTEGDCSHAEGNQSQAIGYASHAEGSSTVAEGNWSHAEGESTAARWVGSHAEGRETIAEGGYSHAEGYGTITSRSYQHVEGMYNIPDDDKYLHIVGNGSGEDIRRNAYTLDTEGNGWFAGNLKVGGSSQEDENAVSVLTTADIDTIIQSVIDSLRSNGYIQ